MRQYLYLDKDEIIQSSLFTLHHFIYCNYNFRGEQYLVMNYNLAM